MCKKNHSLVSSSLPQRERPNLPLVALLLVLSSVCCHQVYRCLSSFQMRPWGLLFATYGNTYSPSDVVGASYLARAQKLAESTTLPPLIVDMNELRVNTTAINQDEAMKDLLASLMEGDLTRPVLIKNVVLSNTSPEQVMEKVVEAYGDKKATDFAKCPYVAFGEKLKSCRDQTLAEKISAIDLAEEEKRRLVFFYLNTADINTIGEAQRFWRHELGIHSAVAAFLDRFEDRHSAGYRTLNVLMSIGRTIASSYHAHLDSVFNINVASIPKVWNLVHPDLFPLFSPRFDGQTFLFSSEMNDAVDTGRVPSLSFVQEPGDMLFIPSWWAHRTQFASQDDGSSRTQSVNLHFVRTDPVSWIHATLSRFKLGDLVIDAAGGMLSQT